MRVTGFGVDLTDNVYSSPEFEGNAGYLQATLKKNKIASIHGQITWGHLQN